MIRLITKAGSSVFRFSESHPKGPKNVNQYLKMKKNEQIASQLINNKDNPEELQWAQKLLYVPFFPAAVLAVPILYLMGDPTDALFLGSCNAMQYYLSGIVCFNAYFTHSNANKYYYFIFAAVASNCISGPYGIITPIILGLLNFYAPFTDEKHHKFQTREQQMKVKVYLKAQGLYYFLAALILTLKFYHFQTVRGFQMRLKNFQEENRKYFASHNE